MKSIEEYGENISGGLERAEEEYTRKAGSASQASANLRLIEEGATKYAEILFSALEFGETVPLRGLS